MYSRTMASQSPLCLRWASINVTISQVKRTNRDASRSPPPCQWSPQCISHIGAIAMSSTTSLFPMTDVCLQPPSRARFIRHKSVYGAHGPKRALYTRAQCFQPCRNTCLKCAPPITSFTCTRLPDCWAVVDCPCQAPYGRATHMSRIMVHMCFHFLLTSAVCPASWQSLGTPLPSPYMSCTCLRWCSGAGCNQGPAGRSGSGPHSSLPHSPGGVAKLGCPWSVPRVCPVASGGAGRGTSR